MTNYRIPCTILVALSAACSGFSEVGPLEPTAETDAPLTTTAATGSVYRLNAASFVIYDHSGNRVASVQPAPGDPTTSVTLKPGNYRVTLQPGWLLQRKVDTGWVDMRATNTAMPVGEFIVNPNKATPLVFQFSAGFTSGAVTSTTTAGLTNTLNPGATGTALISIQVDDCGLYVSKISGLASFTIDCLGTLNSTQYSQVGGQLYRNFTHCTTGNAGALDSIDGLLSLQFDRPDLVAEFPEAQRDVDTNKAYSTQCVSVAYEKWRAKTATSGPNVCPVWTLSSQQNAPEVGVGAALAAGFPPVTIIDDEEEEELDGDEIFTVGAPTPALVAMEKVGITYDVTFPAGSPTPNCGTAAQCAIACAGGFSGFVLTQASDSKITADPAYWELGTVYTTQNPFLTAGYYHAMADYGPVPGDQFGNAQRALATTATGAVVGEACSYYLRGTRFLTQLIYNKNTTGAVSWCRQPQ